MITQTPNLTPSQVLKMRRAALVPAGYFAVANYTLPADDPRDWDGPGIDDGRRPWLNRTDIGSGTGYAEVADYLDDDGTNSDWFVRWPERVLYDGTSCGFLSGEGVPS